MELRSARYAAVAVVVIGLLAGCGSDASSASTAATAASSSPVMDPGDGGNYRPQLDPAKIADVIDNPYLPLTVGSHWRYEGQSDGATEVVEVVVTPDRKTITGISAFVVRDTVTADGEVIEDTYDWFTQDSDGNVWYLGEDVKEYENGAVVSTDGSWEAGVDGALPGIAMPAVPQVGKVHRQEFDAGNAEDMMTIAKIGGSLTVPAGTYTDLLTTQEWTPLEPDVIEEKAYAPGIGMVWEKDVQGADGLAELVEFTAGS